MRIIVNEAGLTPALLRTVHALAKTYPITTGHALSKRAGELFVTLAPGAEPGVLEITRAGNNAKLAYDTPARACRGLGALLAGLAHPGRLYREQTSLSTLGVMLDCSRNAVMKPEHLRQWLLKLALLGYNQFMLYTENTYEIPGEPYFGYRRGRYSQQELRGIDDYAAALGIEMVGCIQTLGHLEQLLRFPKYENISDTASVLMVDHPETYALIEKMIAVCAASFRSRRLHIGMDEAFDLGRGRTLTQRGYEPPFNLFSRHLTRVAAICKKHGLKPMIWSDMFFRMGSKKHDYYDPESRIPQQVARKIPRDVDLVYWDYVNKPVSHFMDMVKRHRALGHEPIMATAVNTLQTLWFADTTGIEPSLAACNQAGLREALVTLWGDDGAYCEFNSALAGLAKAAELAHAQKLIQPTLQARFQAVCGADYKAVMAAAGMFHPRSAHTALFWDDPLLRVAWVNEGLIEKATWQKADKRFGAILKKLRHVARVTEPINMAHAVNLLKFLRAKIAFQQSLDQAYKTRNNAALLRVRGTIPSVIRELDKVMASHRAQWHYRNKPFGFETIQIRLAGQRLRWQEMGIRLDELTSGKVVSLPELEERPTEAMPWTHIAWRFLAVSGIA